jgi:hypothetical protein
MMSLKCLINHTNRPYKNPGPIEKKRKSKASHKRRAQKRAKAAASGHGPHMYATNPTATMHHAEELPPLKTPVDAASFLGASSGSWIGRRPRTADPKKKPWMVPELLKDEFTMVEWDGT